MSAVKNVLISCVGANSQSESDAPGYLALMEGRPLIQWQLDYLRDVENVVVVVGSRPSELMRTVLERRPDAIFVVNHDSEVTGILDSMAMAVRWMREPFIYLDGDSLVNSSAIELMASAPCPSIGIRRTRSDNPLCVRLGTNDSEGLVIGFTSEPSEYEWIGLAKLLPQHIKAARGADSLHGVVERFLPMTAVEVQCVEVMPEPDSLSLRMRQPLVPDLGFQAETA